MMLANLIASLMMTTAVAMNNTTAVLQTTKQEAREQEEFKINRTNDNTYSLDVNIDSNANNTQVLNASVTNNPFGYNTKIQNDYYFQSKTSKSEQIDALAVKYVRYENKLIDRAGFLGYQRTYLPLKNETAKNRLQQSCVLHQFHITPYLVNANTNIQINLKLSGLGTLEKDYYIETDVLAFLDDVGAYVYFDNVLTTNAGFSYRTYDYAVNYVEVGYTNYQQHYGDVVQGISQEDITSGEDIPNAEYNKTININLNDTEKRSTYIFIRQVIKSNKETIQNSDQEFEWLAGTPTAESDGTYTFNDFKSFWYVGGVTINGTKVLAVINYEEINIPMIMFEILTMPWTFISVAFNVTLFPNTPFQVNISNLFLTIVAVLIFVFILKKLLNLAG